MVTKTVNKLYSRAEVRCILRELRNDCAITMIQHRDAFRKDPSHVEETCKICLGRKGMIEGMDAAFRHFGGRS